MRNCGIDLLKIGMCFIVVVCHCWHGSHPWNLLSSLLRLLETIAVPVFFFVSFLFFGKKLNDGVSVETMRDRIIRLLIPQVFWAVFFFIVLYVAGMIGVCVKPTVGELGWQIVAGHTLDKAMWFQIDLILVTLLMILLSKAFGKRLGWGLAGLAVIAFALEYSGLNWRMFGELRPEVKFTLGRIVEMVPYAVAGILLSKFIPVFERHRAVSIVVLFAITILSGLMGKKFQSLSFFYAGVEKVISAVALSLLCYVIPFNKLPGSVVRLISFVAPYTLGIYCIHSIVPALGVGRYGLGFCAIVFSCSFFACLLLSRVPLKFVRYSVRTGK